MNLPKQFESYLKDELKVRGATLRNYRSDIGHFLSWTTLHLKAQGVDIENDNVVPHFTGLLVANYKTYHIENKIPEGTTNRRLSTLRNFGKFLVKSGLLTENPAQLLNNLSKDKAPLDSEVILEEFETHLKEEGISRVTLKNYLSDIRQFLSWIPTRAT